jgi:hypothetical protein
MVIEMFWKKKKKTDNLKSDISKRIYIDKKGYPRFKDNGKLVHIAVKKKQVGGKIYSGYDVHHDDENKMNFRKNNLQLIKHPNHSKLHWLKRKNKIE